MNAPISFFVQGLPKPAGSKRGFAIKKDGEYTGSVAIVDASKGSKDWKTDIKIAARAVAPETLIDRPVILSLVFYMPRPKNHFGTGSKATQLKGNAPASHTIKPDVLKLARAVEDALTKIIWVDDCQIVDENISKEYCDVGSSPVPGVSIVVSPLPPQW